MLASALLTEILPFFFLASALENEEYAVASKVVLAGGIYQLYQRLKPRKKGIAGRRVLITGVSGGIGKLVAVKLCQEGWRVWGVDMDQEGLNKLQSQTGPNFTPVRISLSDEKACENLVSSIGADGGSLHALVNIAGLLHNGPALAHTEQEMRQIFEVNAFAPMRLTRLCFPLMLRNASNAGGTVCIVTSSGDTCSWPFSGYCKTLFCLFFNKKN